MATTETTRTRAMRSAGKPHASGSEMARNVAGDAFADDLDQVIADRVVMKKLLGLRAVRDLSQGDLAKVFGCTQSRISKLESSADASVSLGELAKYAEALGLGVTVVLAPNDDDDHAAIRIEVRDANTTKTENSRHLSSFSARSKNR